jgi:hypothetical protein
VTRPFGGDSRRIILAETLEASPARGCDVGSPFRSSHSSVSGVDTDSAINDWDEMGVGDEVQYSAGPWPIDATEEDVAVQGFLESFLFHDAVFDCSYIRVLVGGSAANSSNEGMGLRTL